MSAPQTPANIAAQLRRDLDAIDAAAIRRALAIYGAARRRLMEQISSLIEALGDPTTAVTSNAMALVNRSELLRQIETVLTRAGVQIEPTLIEARRTAITTALDAAEAFMQSQGASIANQIDIAADWVRLDEMAVRELVNTLNDGTPMSRWLRGLGPETAKAVEETIERAIAEHVNVGDLGRELAKQTELAERRAMLITRESTFAVQRRATDQAYQANRRILRGKMRIERLDEKTCRACVALNGTIYPVDQIIPTHVGCRMTIAPVPRGGIGLQEIEDGDEWLRGQSETLQRRTIGSEEGWQAWTNGDVDLIDFVETYETEWGPQTRIVGAERAKVNATQRRARAAD